MGENKYISSLFVSIQTTTVEQIDNLQCGFCKNCAASTSTKTASLEQTEMAGPLPKAVSAPDQLPRSPRSLRIVEYMSTQRYEGGSVTESSGEYYASSGSSS